MISEELRVVVRAEAAQAIRELQNVQKATTGGTEAFKGMAKTLIGVGGVTASLMAFKRIVVDTVASSIRYAAALQQQATAFRVLLGSAEGAESLMKDIQEFSARTPFMVDELTSVAQVLVATGTAAGDVTRVLENLGNASMGNSEKLGRLADAYSKLQTKGKASLEEINRFTEAGVPILEALQEQYGFTREELFDYISTGRVGFEDVNRALQRMTEGEGRFAGMLEEQSKTLTGAFSTLKGEVDLLKAALVEGMVDPLTTGVTLITQAVAEMRLLVEQASRLKGISPWASTAIRVGDVSDIPGMTTGEQSQMSLQMKMTPAEWSAYQKTGVLPARLQPTTPAQFTQAPGGIPFAALYGMGVSPGSINAGWDLTGTGHAWWQSLMPGGGNGKGPASKGLSKSQFAAGPMQFLDPGLMMGAPGHMYGGAAGVSPAMNMLLDPTSTMFQGYGGGYFPYGADAQTTMQLMMSQVIGRNKNPLGYGSKAGTPPAFNAVAAGMGIGERGMGLGAFGDEGFTDPTVAAGIDAITRAFDAQADSVFTLDKALAEMEGTLQSLSLQAVTDAAYEFGKALGNGESLALSAAQAMASFWRTIIDSLPQMLLAGAANAAATGNWPLAAGLLAASAAAAVVSGSLAGAESRTPAAATSSAPVINVYGDVNDADRFESKVINVVRSMGSPA